MSEHKFLIIVWIVLIAFIVLFAHGAYAEGVSGTVNKDGSITITKKELIKLGQYIESLNGSLTRAMNDRKAWHDRYEAVHDCVMENAHEGRATTICFEVCPQTNRFCGPETQEF